MCKLGMYTVYIFQAPLNISVPLKPGPLTETWIHLFTNISTSLPLVAVLPNDLLEQLGKRYNSLWHTVTIKLMLSYCH